jgi:hypothetical protein
VTLPVELWRLPAPAEDMLIEAVNGNDPTVVLRTE